jgi:hypothetical protein
VARPEQGEGPLRVGPDGDDDHANGDDRKPGLSRRYSARNGRLFLLDSLRGHDVPVLQTPTAVEVDALDAAAPEHAEREQRERKVYGANRPLHGREPP